MSVCGRKLCGVLLLVGVALFAGAAVQGRRFVHPGIAESAEDIARARRMIAERREPWYGCFKALEKCWSANPKQKVPVYPTRLRPIDCNRTIGSAGRRAHDLALMYRLTDDERYAAKAVEFINASSYYEELDWRGTGPLDYGKIYLLVEAAELLRFHKGWAKEDKERFAKMLRDKFYPLLKNGDPSRFGNQGLFALRGALAIAVFIQDEKGYDRIWRYINALPLRADQEPFPTTSTKTDNARNQAATRRTRSSGFHSLSQSRSCSGSRATTSTVRSTTASFWGLNGPSATTRATGSRAATRTTSARRRTTTGCSTAPSTGRDAGCRSSRIQARCRSSADPARRASAPTRTTAM